MLFSSVGRIFQNSGPFALKLCELMRDFEIGATMFKGFCSLLLRLNRLTFRSSCTRFLIGDGAVSCTQLWTLLFVKVIKLENAYLFHSWFSMRSEVGFADCPN